MGSLTPEAQEGKRVFESSEAACATCHSGPTFSDGLNHDVGLGGDSDSIRRTNTPSLVGTYRKVRWLHDGRSKTLESLLADHHSPEKVRASHR